MTGAESGGPAEPESEAESEADALARLYDLDLAEDVGDDIGLYLALAGRTGGPILELAAGTGRIVRPLAAAGYEVTALDLDPAMLARLGRPSPRITPVIADLTTWRPPRPVYRLAILGLNALFLMAERHLQRAAIESLAAALAPGGVAVVDIWLPDATDLARYDQRLLLDYIRTDPASGRTVTKTVAALHDAATATVLLTSIYDEGRPGAPTSRWIRRDLLRLVGAAELADLARAAGLEVESLAGDYGLEPLGPGDERAILVAHRP
ncbi:MAG TPA: class I SAM-dependent methyltransferase [Candidatus Limnocylindrales bacterium]|nr:class I SAM-dependent methyltransferase [Candidatus Limnocylindrales bacterium]